MGAGGREATQTSELPESSSSGVPGARDPDNAIGERRESLAERVQAGGIEIGGGGVPCVTLLAPVMRFALVLIVLVAIGGVLFATQPSNLDEVRFAIPFTTSEIVGNKLATVLGGFGLGLLLGYLAALPGRFGASRRAKKAEKQLASLGTPAPAPGAPPVAPPPAAASSPGPDLGDASDTQRLADEVARRTSEATR